MTIKKLCSWYGCTKIIEKGKVYCNLHQNKWELKEKVRYKEYQSRRRKDKEQRKFQNFYNSDDWKRIRESIISSCYSIDILEYYRTGKIVQGERVHHIVELEDDWNSRFDIYNLIYLTERNHRRVHVEYSKGEKDKKAMQKILFDLLDKFIKDFGV